MSSTYLFTGPEAGDRNNAVGAVINTLKKTYGAVECYSFFASETPAVEYMAVLQNESLFSATVCVTVKNAESIKKKDDVEMLAAWISAQDSGSNALILVSDEISIDSKLEKAVPPANKKIFWEMFEDRKIPWIQSFCTKNGYRISESAAATMLELTENNTQSLKQECCRFFVCFPPGHEITEADIETLLAHNREENAFSLFDAMTKNSGSERLEKAIEILQKIRLSKENSSVMLIAGLASCFRKLQLWHKLGAAGKTDDFNLKINGFASKKMKQQYAQAARIWTAGQSAAALALLAATDAAIRSGAAAFEDILLQKLLYEITVKKGAPCAYYEPDSL